MLNKRAKQCQDLDDHGHFTVEPICLANKVISAFHTMLLEQQLERPHEKVHKNAMKKRCRWLRERKATQTH